MNSPTASLSDSQKLDVLLGKMTALENELRPWLTDIEKRLSFIEGQLSHLERKAEYAEAQDKRMNLIFSGLPEASGRESWAEVEQLSRL